MRLTIVEVECHDHRPKGWGGLPMTITYKLLGGWSKIWTLSAPRFNITTGRTRLRIVNRDWATRGLSSWKPDWKTSLIARALTARPGNFFDVGANIGQTLLDWMSAPIRSSYVGFEPNSICVRHLKSVIEDNEIANARIIPAGLSGESGILNLYLSSATASDSGASMMADLRPDQHHVPTPIPVFRLDEIASALPEGGVSLIKIDVEGAELHTLRGMAGTLADCKPWVMCEVLHRDGAADQASYLARNASVVQFLNSVRYEIYRIVQSEDRLTVAALEQVIAFPDAVYTEASKTACDYMFLPIGDYKTAAAALLE